MESESIKNLKESRFIVTAVFLKIGKIPCFFRKIIYQTIYLTPKKNLVYYQREDLNYDSEWWLRKHKDLPFYHQQEADTVFKICQAFAELSSYLDKSTINKLEQKLAAGAFIETLNI